MPHKSTHNLTYEAKPPSYRPCSKITEKHNNPTRLHKYEWFFLEKRLVLDGS